MTTLSDWELFYSFGETMMTEKIYEETALGDKLPSPDPISFAKELEMCMLSYHINSETKKSRSIFMLFLFQFIYANRDFLTMSDDEDGIKDFRNRVADKLADLEKDEWKYTEIFKNSLSTYFVSWESCT